jgi:hypothetical protein
MSAILIAYVDIDKVEMASQLHAWCGLAVRSAPCSTCKGKPSEDGSSCNVCGGGGMVMEADRRRKGEKTRFNPWLKSKVLTVLGGSFLKANSPWRKHYDDYKNRKKNQKVDKCMLCWGTGKYVSKPRPGARPGPDGQLEVEAVDVKPHLPPGTCPNCEGRGRDCPWGRSDAHRHNAALRYMCKMFLTELYVKWRTIEGLSVRAPYAEEYLGRVHHTS